MAELFQPCNSIVTDSETPAARLLRAAVRRESCRIKPALPGVTPAALQMRFQAYLKDWKGHSDSFGVFPNTSGSISTHSVGVSGAARASPRVESTVRLKLSARG